MATQPLIHPKVTVEEYLATVYRPDCDYIDGEVQERNFGEWDHSSLHVWVVDPETTSAYSITPAEGWREIKDGVLRAANPSLEVPLSELFS